MWVEKETVAANAVDDETSTKATLRKDNKRSTRHSSRQGGPTTEAGRLKQEEAQAAKLAKIERRREKNRKKRQAYRSRKKMAPPPRQGSSSIWKTTTKVKPKTREEIKQEQKQERRRQKERQKKEAKEHERAERKQRRQLVRDARHKLRSNELSEDEWEKRLGEALDEGNFTLLQELFLLVLLSHAERGGGRATELSRRYRALSCRFHPDKQKDSTLGEHYKIAFQALNEAHQMSREQFVQDF